MKSIRFILLSVLISTSLQLKAWDEVSHAYMTHMIPDQIKNQELRQLLKNNLDEYVYGCWYTDTYQYTKHKSDRVNALNPHYIATYGKAFKNYLQKEEVKKQKNYDKLVALYLGSLSHLLEDFWYDSNLNRYQKTKSDKHIGDSRHGAFVAKQHGYINLKVKRYFPKEDLFKMYQEAEMLEPEYDTIEKFTKMLDSWSNQQYLLLRSLKFINFLGGNQMYNESPWTAGNLKEIKGGMENSAEVAAIFIEEIWYNLQQKQVPKILHADYFDFENKLAILTSIPIDAKDISGNNIYLITNSKDTISGKINQFEHNDKKKGITKYAISFFPDRKLKKGIEYSLVINANNIFPNAFVYNFQPGTYVERPADPKPFLSTLGLGIFGFIPLLAFSGLFYGVSGIIKFNWDYKNEGIKLPAVQNAIQRILQITAVLTLAFGFYVLATKGEMIIGMAF